MAAPHQRAKARTTNNHPSLDLPLQKADAHPLARRCLQGRGAYGNIPRMAPDCSIVIVSWNVRELLRACLRSLPGAAPGPSTSSGGALACEVIVVDNASTDGSVEV